MPSVCDVSALKHTSAWKTTLSYAMSALPHISRVSVECPCIYIKEHVVVKVSVGRFVLRQCVYDSPAAACDAKNPYLPHGQADNVRPPDRIVPLQGSVQKSLHSHCSCHLLCVVASKAVSGGRMSTRRRGEAPNGTNGTVKSIGKAGDQQTDFTRWRLRNDRGVQTWHYLENEQSKAWPMSVADKYFLGFDTVGV